MNVRFKLRCEMQWHFPLVAFEIVTRHFAFPCSVQGRKGGAIFGSALGRAFPSDDIEAHQTPASAGAGDDAANCLKCSASSVFEKPGWCETEALVFDFTCLTKRQW